MGNFDSWAFHNASGRRSPVCPCHTLFFKNICNENTDIQIQQIQNQLEICVCAFVCLRMKRKERIVSVMFFIITDKARAKGGGRQKVSVL